MDKIDWSKVVLYNDGQCPICLEVLQVDNKAWPPCGHVFCYYCLARWCKRKQKCPLCKQNIQIYRFVKPKPTMTNPAPPGRPSQNPPAVPPSQNPPAVMPSQNPPAAQQRQNPSAVPPSQNRSVVDEPSGAQPAHPFSRMLKRFRSASGQAARRFGERVRQQGTVQRGRCNFLCCGYF